MRDGAASASFVDHIAAGARQSDGFVRALLLVLLLGGCHRVSTPAPSCATPGGCLDAAPDEGPWNDAADERATDVPIDTGPPPPWADGTWRLPNMPHGTTLPERCGGATPLTNWWYSNGATGLCQFQDYLFINSVGGEVFRLSPTLDVSLVLGLGQTEAGGYVRCSRDGLYAVAVDRDRRRAIVRFDRVDGPGRVVWSAPAGTPEYPASGMGIGELTVTERLVAWVHEGSGAPPTLYVSGPRGERPHPLPASIVGLPYHLQADGDRLVFVSGRDLWMYTASTDALENLTHDAAAQWDPWVSGDHLVWMDQRDNPGHDDWSPDNPEVYFMDLRDRVPVRITHDPPERPVLQYGPVVRGDWIVWADFRHNAAPNRLDPRGGAEVYGYRLDRREEYPLLTGAHQVLSPTLLGDDVYFVCGPPVLMGGNAPPAGLHRMALPR